MRKSIVLAMIGLMGLSTTVNAQWWTGYSAKTGLALSLHLQDSALNLYSPMQTTDPIPVSSWSYKNNELKLECKTIGLKMNLKRVDNDFEGTWRQGLLKESIVFYPADTMFTLRRPQTPQPPYVFEQQDVEVDYVDSHGNEVHLSGTLTYPRGDGRYPCLVMVSGSGQQNRDEELFQHRPFLVLANYLAGRGVAMLRYDDRGVGGSTGNLDEATTYLFSEDAEAMLMAAHGNPHVDTSALGIGGHSEGGAIAPMVAARNSAAKYVVMLAGQGCTGREVLLQQNQALMLAAGASPHLATVRTQLMADVMALEPNSNLAQYKALIERHTSGLSKSQLDTIALGKGAAYQLHKQMETSWMRAFVALDPQAYLPKLHCPVLALNGSKDCQVLPKPNLEGIGRLCPQAECIELQGLNHLFQRCTTGSANEYIIIEETLNQELLAAVADFILGLHNK